MSNTKLKELLVDAKTAAVVAKFPPAIRARYDFSNAQYTRALEPITGIRCHKHGEFQQYSAQLRNAKAGCPTCGAEQRAISRALTQDEFLTRCRAEHAGVYDYSLTQYTGMREKITVGCREHGPFQISPIKHLHGGQGCPACGAKKRGKRLSGVNVGAKAAEVRKKKHAKTFVARAQAVHGDRYDYSETVYVAARQSITVRCREHGPFTVWATAHVHDRQGCPTCSHICSLGEAQVSKFLSGLATVSIRDRSVIKPKELDIYLPEHQLAVEYCGEYWHSHGDPEDERQAKNRHEEKHRMCADKGIRLITLWESEWVERRYAIQRLLRNALGKSRGKLMARKCELRKATPAEARVFYDRYHPQGGAGTGEHYALFWKGKMVACMRFALGSNDRGAGAAARGWTLARFATRITVAGAASRLFRAFVDEHKPDEVKSFSDNRLFGGGMYAQLGFAMEADLPPDYQVWSPRIGLRPKSHYQRRLLQQRLREHDCAEVFDHETDPRTEAEITYLMGARRLYDCGKKRWVWRSA